MGLISLSFAVPNYNDGYEVLFWDETKSGASRDWRRRKKESEVYAQHIRQLEQEKIIKSKKAANTADCGNYLIFKKTDNKQQRLIKAFFCKSRLCPMCNWRRSLKCSFQAMNVINEFKATNPTAKFIFVTLTMKNATDGIQLNHDLSLMTAAWHRMIGRKKYNDVILGFLRSTEITVNKQDGSYNQHMHVLLAVKSGYYSGHGRYITHTQWANDWGRALKITDYVPRVHVQAVKQIESAVLETAKYSVKSTDYLSNQRSDEENRVVIGDLENAFRGKRFIGWGKEFKAIHRRLNLVDLETDVEPTTESNDIKYDTEQVIIAKWDDSRQNYYCKNANEEDLHRFF
jgi:plasmid rolling circle replication initiator protein Rep